MTFLVSFYQFHHSLNTPLIWSQEGKMEQKQEGLQPLLFILWDVWSYLDIFNFIDILWSLFIHLEMQRKNADVFPLNFAMIQHYVGCIPDRFSTVEAF